MLLPVAKGNLSEWLVRTLTGRRVTSAIPLPAADRESWNDADLQLALWCCYELHYRGFDDVDDRWEWDPRVLEFRAALEDTWESAVRSLCRPMLLDDRPVPQQLRALIDADEGPSLTKYLQRHATIDEFRRYVMHRSAYQLKEADPHSFGIPRLDGRVKAALVEIQTDEYGGGRAARMHSELFKATMRWLGLSTDYGHYIGEVPAVTLAVSNLMSLFGLHRKHLPSLLGHLAALEMTSTVPNRRLAAGARRLGAPAEATLYFEEHVEADAVHEQIAAHDLCQGYADQYPESVAAILFGARACLALDALVAGELLAEWGAERPAAQ